MKKRYGAQWRNVRYRRLQTSRKRHWLDNTCLTELTLDKSTSISKINRWKKVREGAAPGLSLEKEGKDLVTPDGSEANCPEEEAHILHGHMKNWKLMNLLRKRRKTGLLSQKKTWENRFKKHLIPHGEEESMCKEWVHLSQLRETAEENCCPVDLWKSGEQSEGSVCMSTNWCDTA